MRAGIGRAVEAGTVGSTSGGTVSGGRVGGVLVLVESLLDFVHDSRHDCSCLLDLILLWDEGDEGFWLQVMKVG